MKETDYTPDCPAEEKADACGAEQAAVCPERNETAAVREARIRHYEALLNEAERVLSDYEAAMERFVAVQEKIAELNAYYGSRDWWADFDAWEAGELPPGLPCGVLSEDAVWNLLERNREYIEED